MKFKPDEFVVCVWCDKSVIVSELKLNKIYKIHKISDIKDIIIIEIDGKERYFYKERFESLLTIRERKINEVLKN